MQLLTYGSVCSGIEAAGDSIMTTLQQYIDDYHKGNRSAFAASYGTTYRQVLRWLAYGCVWCDGVVYAPIKKPG